VLNRWIWVVSLVGMFMMCSLFLRSCCVKGWLVPLLFLIVYI